MEDLVMKNDAFYILWYVIFSYLYMDLMEFEINAIQYNSIKSQIFYVQLYMANVV
jgi:hypothetical protein